MERVLVSWVGGHDIAASGRESDTSGPIFSTISREKFDRLVLLYNYPEKSVSPFLDWLRHRTEVAISANYVELTSPIHFGEIYEVASDLLESLAFGAGDKELHILLSPGTPAMQAVWILLAKTGYQATFWQSSVEGGVEEATIPFDIAAEYVPVADKLSSDAISRLAMARVPIDAAFDDIVTQSPIMKELKGQATVLAVRDLPVLICGESGTGKELFARAIHNASRRADMPFVPVNCGAFPPDLIDSILFGHKKGAFTGAMSDKPGFFEEAHGGTIFLDEFGELSPQVQVRLLRVLEDGSFTPVGDTREKRVDVRLITATNRDLAIEVSGGNFREDLFYRVAVGVLRLPPLRERHGDLSLLADYLLEAIGAGDENLLNKQLSAEARSVILRQSWRGNVRELRSVLLRAVLWGAGDKISGADVERALFEAPEEESILGRDISEGIDLEGLITEVYRHYIERALLETGGNKSRATEVLRLGSYQNLNTRMKNCGIV